MARLDPVRGLVLACHPLPCLAVTGFAAAYALSVGLGAGRTVLLAAAILTGQLSIGWCNDAVDAGRDTAAGRSDKPAAVGLVAVRVLARAAGVALIGCAALSLALGLRAGVVHLVAVGSGWAYDLGVKSTVASWAPYGLSFALLPAVATAALPESGWPPAAVLGGAALLGVAAHFANTVGDVEADAATGVRGLPQRLGPVRSLVVTAGLVALAAVVLALGSGSGARPPAGALGLFAGGALLAAGAAVLCGALARPSRLAFRLTLAAVALVVAGFLLAA